MNYSKLILKTSLQNNSDEYFYKPEFVTEDFVYLPSLEEFNQLNEPNIKVPIPSDYAILNDCYLSYAGWGARGNGPLDRSLCRDRSNGFPETVQCLDYAGSSRSAYPDVSNGSSKVAMRLDMKQFINELKNSPDSFKISKSIDYRLAGDWYTLEFGEYPQNYVGRSLDFVLEQAHRNNSDNLVPTGKRWLGCWMENWGMFDFHSEYMFQGKKYVRVKAHDTSDDEVTIPDRTANNSMEIRVNDGQYFWCEVQPIKWLITNWDKLPKEINPNGTGNQWTTSTVDLLTEDCLLPSMPFYAGKVTDNNREYWQNSTMRGYLNGINVNFTTNGNMLFSAPNGGDFTSSNNFLSDAFDIDPQLLKNANNYTKDIEKGSKYMNLKKFIVPMAIENVDNNFELGDPRFVTKDRVYIDDKMEVSSQKSFFRINYPSDYRAMNGTLVSGEKYGVENRKTCSTYLRTGVLDNQVSIVNIAGDILTDGVDYTYRNFRPILNLDLESFIPARQKSEDLFKIDSSKTRGGNHTIEFGEYPQTYVGDDKNRELVQLESNMMLEPTRKKYLGRFDYQGKPIYNDEYILDGQKYVKVITYKYDSESVFSDGSDAPNDGTVCFAKVEPIQWIIKNWESMPKEINPNGTGTAQTMEIQTQYAICGGVPFYPQKNWQDPNKSLWQNSSIRGYLNGINVNNIITNGNVFYTAPNGGDFTEHNFLNEVFDNVMTLTASNSAEQIKKDVVKKKRKGYGVTIEENPLSVKEQMKFYIDNGKSFMLHGPSGIGKTRRVEELDPDLVSVVLRKGMLPEEVIGKTIYPNNETSDGGEWKAPSWYLDICNKAKARGDEKVVLFLDELTNSLYEQNLVFHLTLNRCIQPNLGKLPDNVVVVAAGNNQDESASAYNMTEPLFRRFDGHIYLEPNIPEWLEWGSEDSGKGDGRLKIHPLISNFISAYGMDVFYTNYDRDNPPKYVLDPRGWEQVSDIIYDNNGVLAKELIENKVGTAIATSLIAFAKKPVITLEDVVNENYFVNEIPGSPDGKLALALSLRYADKDEVGIVREFIRDHLGEEILATYDATYVGDDSEKALFISTLEEERKQNKSESSEEVQMQTSEEISQNNYGNHTKHSDKFHITVDDFWDPVISKSIHCDEAWKASYLTQVFDRMGKTWWDGDSYAQENCYGMFKEETCYSNIGSVEGLSESKQRKRHVFEFEEVDLTKYLTEEEIEDIWTKLPTGKEGAYADMRELPF